MVAPEVPGIDLFKIANRSISGWIPSLKTGTTATAREGRAGSVSDQPRAARRNHDLLAYLWGLLWSQCPGPA